MTTWLIGTLLLGCDAEEGLLKETREVVQAIEDRESLGKIGKQAQDVIDEIDRNRKVIDKRLKKAEAWVDKARTKVRKDDEAVEAVEGDLADKLAELEEEVARLRAQMGTDEEVDEVSADRLSEIEQAIRALAGAGKGLPELPEEDEAGAEAELEGLGTDVAVE